MVFICTELIKTDKGLIPPKKEIPETHMHLRNSNAEDANIVRISSALFIVLTFF
jgi:hypothetical protein